MGSKAVGRLFLRGCRRTLCFCVESSLWCAGDGLGAWLGLGGANPHGLPQATPQQHHCVQELASPSPAVCCSLGWLCPSTRLPAQHSLRGLAQQGQDMHSQSPGTACSFSACLQMCQRETRARVGVGRRELKLGPSVPIEASLSGGLWSARPGFLLHRKH